jgi:hypothetical protein
MLTAIKEEVEVLPGGILQLHTHNLPEHTMVSVSAILELPDTSVTTIESAVQATAGILQEKIGNPVEWQCKLRSEWDDRELTS